MEKFDELDEDREKQNFQCIRNILSLYDKRTLLLIGLTFFNEGSEFMLILAVTYQFLVYYHAEPMIVTLHIALICIPEGLAFVFGLLSDSTDVLGFGKRFYIIIASLLQISMSLLVTLYGGVHDVAYS